MRDDIDLKYFKKRLEERLKAITAGQERQKKEAAPVELDQARVGRLSRMDAMQQQAMSQAAARLSDLERQRIQSALGRMQSDDYGYCVLCDEEIAEGRLRFDPSVLMCISCAKEADEKSIKPGFPSLSLP
ncbi:MAG: TraR/DksA C4-type zinc finger protein [Desulfobulbaceae bacterium]|nr:TraR/DksA C4-type zinc finger protein [Desulfobulbaceae bacterium]